MNLDVRVEGSRIASELVHLREISQTERPKSSINSLFLLAVKGFILGLGLVCALMLALFLNAEVAFISITATAFVTFGLVMGGRKIAALLSPIEKKLFANKNH